jgi:hypothetical protein
MLSKGDVCEMLEGVGALQKGKYDTALPQPWVNALNELGIANTGSYVWDYSEDRAHGKPLDICGLFVKHFGQEAKSYLFLIKKETSDV